MHFAIFSISFLLCTVVAGHSWSPENNENLTDAEGEGNHEDHANHSNASVAHHKGETGHNRSHPSRHHQHHHQHERKRAKEDEGGEGQAGNLKDTIPDDLVKQRAKEGFGPAHHNKGETMRKGFHASRPRGHGRKGEKGDQGDQGSPGSFNDAILNDLVKEKARERFGKLVQSLNQVVARVQQVKWFLTKDVRNCNGVPYVTKCFIPHVKYVRNVDRARELCRDNGMNLADVEDAELQTLLEKFLRKNYGNVNIWTAMKYPAQNTIRYSDGREVDASILRWSGRTVPLPDARSGIILGVTVAKKHEELGMHTRDVEFASVGALCVK